MTRADDYRPATRGSVFGWGRQSYSFRSHPWKFLPKRANLCGHSSTLSWVLVAEDGTQFARSFQQFMGGQTQTARTSLRSPIRDLLEGHVGTECATLPVISDSFPPYDHANVQVALSAYLDENGRSHQLLGLSGQQRHFESLADLVHGARFGVEFGSVDFVNLPVSPNATLCVQFGLFLIDAGAHGS